MFVRVMHLKQYDYTYVIKFEGYYYNNNFELL